MDPIEAIQLAKRSLRDQVRARLAELTPEELLARSDAACRHLMATEAFRHADSIMLYMPISTEVDVSHIALRCFQENRIVCLPRIDWEHRRMWPVPVRSFDEHALVDDRYGLKVPDKGAPLPIDALDLVVVPGLAFDTEGHRLGRGGGYYDRFLAASGFVGRKMGLCFDAQIVDAVPTVGHDVPMDAVVTDRRVIAVNPAANRRPGV